MSHDAQPVEIGCLFKELLCVANEVLKLAAQGQMLLVIDVRRYRMIGQRSNVWISIACVVTYISAGNLNFKLKVDSGNF